MAALLRGEQHQVGHTATPVQEGLVMRGAQEPSQVGGWRSFFLSSCVPAKGLQKLNSCFGKTVGRCLDVKHRLFLVRANAVADGRFVQLNVRNFLRCEGFWHDDV